MFKKQEPLKLNLQYFATDNIIQRDDAQALIPEEVASEIIKNVPQKSVIMSQARRLQNMSTKKRRMPVLSALPMAYFVDGEAPSGGLKQTTQMAWANKYLEAEEIAVIVPIPEAVLDDASYDIWGEVRPSVEEAFGAKFDRAVLFGEEAPASWPKDIYQSAQDSGNIVTLGTGEDLYDDLLGEGGLVAAVEESGFGVNGHIASLKMRGKLRGLRDSTGQPIFKRSIQDGTRYALDGDPMHFPENGAIGFTDPVLQFAGAWNQLVYAMRQDITYKILDQAVITDADGKIIYNLAQQDMVALRVVMRLAWQVPNPINHIVPDESERYPFAVLAPNDGGVEG